MKPHVSHDFTGSPRCIRCSEYVLSLDAKLPCKPQVVTFREPAAPLWDQDDPLIEVEF